MDPRLFVSDLPIFENHERWNASNLVASGHFLILVHINFYYPDPFAKFGCHFF